MNATIGFIFRIIPLCMALICFGLGWYILGNGTDTARILPGLVVFFLGSICIALFCTASIIIYQLLGKFTPQMKYVYPGLGYLTALVTLIAGLILLSMAETPQLFVAGHVVCGLAFITGCVSTAATASLKFYLIPVNSRKAVSDSTPPQGCFTSREAFVIKLLPILFAIMAWVWGFSLLGIGMGHPYDVAGLVMLGLAAICTSLIALVWSIEEQSSNHYRPSEKRGWATLVVIMGSTCLLLGLCLLIFNHDPYIIAPGFVLIGLGLICYSISSKIILLALVWKASYPLANRIPLIPIFTALISLFLSSFLFEATSTNANFYVPAHVMAGLGAICFCLFSIVSILENGTKK